MGVSISYMGTKRELAPAVGDVIKHAQAGVMLDAFSGMCSVGEEVAPNRQIWSNDVQIFASEIARALFTSYDPPAAAMSAADQHFEVFEAHRIQLAKNHEASIAAEDESLEALDFDTFSRRTGVLSLKLASEVRQRRPLYYRLFTTLYSNNYFGLRQAIEADAIIRSVCSAQERGRISSDQKRWMMIALGRALLKIANSTGHFAQFLKPKKTSYKRLIAKRRRRLWGEWLFSVGELAAVGSVDWRKRNKAFNQDSLALLPAIAASKERPSVIYADPPYTDDQYSRYYHILDTLMLYDYPSTSGAGIYRFRTFFYAIFHKIKVSSGI